jgi:hypothetical protein
MSERPLSNYNWDTSGQITSTGSANAYVIASASPITGYYQGMPPIRFKANFTNTGSATANVNDLGAVTLKKGGGATNLAAGDIVSGGVYTLSHDGTNFQVLELNSPAVTSVGGLPLSSSGDRWGVLPFVHTDGVMEIGRYIDFHVSDADTSDYAIRLEASAGSQNLHMTPAAGVDAGVLKRLVTVIDSTQAQGDLVYFNGTNWVRLAAGTSGQFLKTNGAAANPAWAAAGPTAGTVQASTSGTAITFSGLPAGLKRITVMFDGVDLSGGDNFIVQIGDSGGIETTGYTSGSFNRAAQISDSNGYIISRNSGSSAGPMSGIMTLIRITGNTWVSSHALNENTDTVSCAGGGTKTLSAELDRVSVTPTGTNTFNAGQINILYEL